VTTRPELSDEYPYRPPLDPLSKDQPPEGAAATFPQLLDMEMVARWLGTSIRHVRRLVTEGKIPYLKIGHFIRFDERDVETWIERQKVISLDNAVETPGRQRTVGPVVKRRHASGDQRPHLVPE
jgi:excisionase family DNA binding protein